jgi:hypothetical protein
MLEPILFSDAKIDDGSKSRLGQSSTLACELDQFIFDETCRHTYMKSEENFNCSEPLLLSSASLSLQNLFDKPANSTINSQQTKLENNINEKSYKISNELNEIDELCIENNKIKYLNSEDLFNTSENIMSGFSLLNEIRMPNSQENNSIQINSTSSSSLSSSSSSSLWPRFACAPSSSSSSSLTGIYSIH